MDICPLCIKILYLAVRCTCGGVYCSDCYEKFNRTCTICKDINTASVDNKFRQRVIRCSYCTEYFENTSEKIRDHEIHVLIL